MSRKSYIPVAVKVPLNRIRIPASYVHRLDWLKARNTVEAWLLVMGPGRLRLLSSEQVDDSPELKSLAARIIDPSGRDPSVEPYETEGPAAAALSAGLTPVTLSHTNGPGWRVTVPKHSFPMESIFSEGKVFCSLFEGYLEIWKPDRLTHELNVPLGELLE